MADTQTYTGAYRTNRKQESASVSYGYGFFFLALQDYEHGILKRRSEYTLFEYLLSMGEYFLKEGNRGFSHSYSTIKKRTGLSVNTAREIVAKLEQAGFLTTSLKQFRRSETTYFTIHYVEIAKRVAAIYAKPKLQVDEERYYVGRQEKERIERVTQRKRALIRMFILSIRLRRKQRPSRKRRNPEYEW
jgi:DNA-binding Lrp family transcriptional regulator